MSGVVHSWKKYLGHPDYDPTTALLSKSLYNAYFVLSSVGNDIRTNDTSSPWPPSMRTLLSSSFGRPSPNHSFLQEACFETLYVLVLKAGFFELSDILGLHMCHPLFSHLLCTCIHLHDYDFLWHRTPSAGARRMPFLCASCTTT